MTTYDPFRIATEIREQLSSDKRQLAFFFGAGTSIAAGFPSILELTDLVEGSLTGDEAASYKHVRDSIGGKPNVENILDRVRLYRELIGASKTAEVGGIKGAEAAQKLDSAICRAISENVRGEPTRGLRAHVTFAQWIRALHAGRKYPVEIFTTNYDLLFERALEEASVPFFDGFIGSLDPFFLLESVDPGASADFTAIPPRSWTRLWKIHGSVNWRVHRQTAAEVERITRVLGETMPAGSELAVFPSREKYSQSRRLPFLAFQDRFRRLLTGGEVLVVVCGYSFSDQHLNEIIFQGLRANPKLAILALIHGDPVKKHGKDVRCVPEALLKYSETYRNLTVIGPDRLCVGGVPGAWQVTTKKKEEDRWPFWDEELKIFTLGNFADFATYLELFLGFGSFGRGSSSSDINHGAAEKPENA